MTIPLSQGWRTQGREEYFPFSSRPLEDSPWLERGLTQSPECAEADRQSRECLSKGRRAIC